jgi:hypothetical protein
MGCSSSTPEVPTWQLAEQGNISVLRARLKAASGQPAHKRRAALLEQPQGCSPSGHTVLHCAMSSGMVQDRLAMVQLVVGALQGIEGGVDHVSTTELSLSDVGVIVGNCSPAAAPRVSTCSARLELPLLQAAQWLTCAAASGNGEGVISAHSAMKVLLAGGAGANLTSGENGDAALHGLANWAPRFDAPRRPSAAFDSIVGEVESAVTELLQAGAQTGQQNRCGATPLWVCAARNALPVAKLLVAAGADIETAETAGGTTPLNAAAMYGATTVADFLIQSGASVDCIAKDLVKEIVGQYGSAVAAQRGQEKEKKERKEKIEKKEKKDKKDKKDKKADKKDKKKEKEGQDKRDAYDEDAGYTTS